jgi:hypothetical protein
MRAFAIVILLSAFVAAVIMPNDIGTPNFPATMSKWLKAGQNHPLKGKAIAWFGLTEKQGDPSPTSDTRLIVSRSAPCVARVQYSAPLLI